MPMLVCVKCQKFFHPKKNGVAVEEGMPGWSRLGPSPLSRLGWSPYKLWHADLWTCRDCGTDIVAGFAPRPWAEHYMPGYETEQALCPDRIFVDDCI